MDQQYVCPQCGEESDIQGPCPMCGLPMVPVHDDEDGTDYDSSFDDKEDGTTDEESQSAAVEEEASYNPYEE